MPDIPDELVNLILKDLGPDRHALCIASLVNSTFCRIAQSILLSCVRLVPGTADDLIADGSTILPSVGSDCSEFAAQQRCSAFLELMLATPALNHYVRELHLGYYVLLDARTQLVLPQLTRIRTLVMDGTCPHNVLRSLDFRDMEVNTRLNLLLSTLKSRTLPNVIQLTLTRFQAVPETLLDSCVNLHSLTLGMCSFASSGEFPKPLTKPEKHKRHPLYSLTIPATPTVFCFNGALAHWKEHADFAIHELTLTNIALVTVDKLDCISQLLQETKTVIRSLTFGFVLAIDSLSAWVSFFNHPSLIDLEHISIHILSTSTMQYFAHALSQSTHPSLSSLDIHLHIPTTTTPLTDAWQSPQWREFDDALSGDTLAPIYQRSVNIGFLNVASEVVPAAPDKVTGGQAEKLSSLRKALPRSVELGFLYVQGIPV